MRVRPRGISYLDIIELFCHYNITHLTCLMFWALVLRTKIKIAKEKEKANAEKSPHIQTCFEMLTLNEILLHAKLCSSF